MKQALKDLFASKKALVMLAAIAVAVASKLGLNLDPDLVNQILALASVYIVGQGIADHGKEAAKIKADAEPANDNAPAVPARTAQAGFARLQIALILTIGTIGMFAIGTVIMLAVPSCGPKTTAAEHQFVTCAESAAAKDLTPTVESILASGVADWKAQLSALARAFGSDALDCAVQAAKTMFATKVGAGQDTSALSRADEWLKNHGGG